VAEIFEWITIVAPRMNQRENARRKKATVPIDPDTYGQPNVSFFAGTPFKEPISGFLPNEPDEFRFKEITENPSGLIPTTGLRNNVTMRAGATAPASFCIILREEGSHSGLVRTLGKRVCRKAPRVRIPHPPRAKRIRWSEGFEPERGRENILFSRGGRIGKTEGFPAVPIPHPPQSVLVIGAMSRLILSAGYASTF
jgi:hypothetical protein